MIRCITIDSDPTARKQLESYILRIPFLQLVGSCVNAGDAVNYFEDNIVDVVFMEINLPDANGIDFIRSLNAPQPIVVFTTNVTKYAIDSYKLDAAYYIVKPYVFDDFLHSVERVRMQYLLRNGTLSIPAIDYDDAIFFKSDYKIVRLSLNSLICVEGMSEYLKLHTDRKDDKLVILMSMKKLEERLPSSFMRIHKSYIINLKHITEVSRGRISLDNGMVIPIGEIYKDAFQSYIESKFVGK
ncbi:MAG: LytR/AlgR family response regulator transcription factor [Candidatus Cryptobacteroides sp.]